MFPGSLCETAPAFGAGALMTEASIGVSSNAPESSRKKGTNGEKMTRSKYIAE
jgi:hypothetical protein